MYVLFCSARAQVCWKRAVQGVREMCDVCDVTLFNIHWVCQMCGFAVCFGCFRLRAFEPPVGVAAAEDGSRCDNAKSEVGGRCEDPRCVLCDRESAVERWLTCSTNQKPHAQDELMMAQILPSDGIYSYMIPPFHSSPPSYLKTVS